MKKIYFWLFLLIVIIFAAFFLTKKNFQRMSFIAPLNNQGGVLENKTVKNNGSAENGSLPAQNTSIFQPPLDKAGERVTKKYFGIYITEKNSPVQPERFSGYHTGVDFEIFPGELNAEAPVRAICSGNLKLKEYASGYGGLAIEACELNGEAITVIYGHLKLSSISAKAGDGLKAGDVIGILGAQKSAETDYERKHLHLGVHKGADINIRGYVASQAELKNWIDPCLYVCYN